MDSPVFLKLNMQSCESVLWSFQIRPLPVLKEARPYETLPLFASDSTNRKFPSSSPFYPHYRFSSHHFFTSEFVLKSRLMEKNCQVTLLHQTAFMILCILFGLLICLPHTFSQLICTRGLLHSTSISPEKSLNLLHSHAVHHFADGL